MGKQARARVLPDPVLISTVSPRALHWRSTTRGISFVRYPVNLPKKEADMRAKGIIMAAILVLVAATVALPQQNVQEAIAASGQAAIHAAIQRVAPAVVRVEATRPGSLGPWEELFRDPFFRWFFGEPPKPQPETALGSGFVIEYQGKKYVLTNNHVVEGAQEVRVISQDGKTRRAKVLGTDEMLDVAVLEVEGAQELPAAPIGDSDALQVGDWVIAIGNPLGFDYTVTLGIVSALNRDVPRPDGVGYFHRMIQTDAAINPGNSGGPLVNAKGEVVGMNTLIARTTRTGLAVEGINFAVPISEIMKVLPQLISQGKVTRAWLGVYIQNITPGMEKTFGVEPGHGVLVADVVPGSPAEKAGVMQGDIIVSVNGKPIHNVNELQVEIMYRQVGEKVTLGIIRNGQELSIEVTLGERPSEKELAQLPSATTGTYKAFGMTLSDITPELASRYGIPSDVQGVVVLKVEEGSRAFWAGIQKGDVILEVNRHPVKNVADFQKIVSGLPENAEVVLTVLRNGRTRFVLLP